MSLQSTDRKIPMKPCLSSVAIRGCFTDFFPMPSSSSAKFTYSRQNDFGKVVNKLLFTSPKPGFSSYFFTNIHDIGLIQGFEVVPSEKKYTVYCVRDPKIATAKGQILEPSCSSNVSKALERSILRTKHLKDHSAVVSTHPFFSNKYLGQVAEAKLHRRTGDGIIPGIIRDSRLYYEGGNCFFMTKNTDKPAYVIGEDMLTVTHQTLRLDEWFKMPDLRNKEIQSSACIDERIIHSKYNSDLNTWYLQGQIPERINLIAKDLSSSLTDVDLLSVLKEMQAMGLLTVLKFDGTQDKIKGRQIATQYLAQREFVKKYIFPIELQCSEDDITFVPQAAYHLDIFMTPGPNGSMFLQDYNLAVKTLQQVKKNAKELKLTTSDLEQLELFILTTHTLSVQLGPILNKVKKDLIDSGITVIPTPGAFFSYDPKKQQEDLNINFLNCLTGFSPITGNNYYISAGTKTEGKLGDVLMQTYVEFLQSQCPNISVYFVGRNPENDTDFSEAMSDLKIQRLGPHCLSYELSIKKPCEEKSK